MKPTTILRTLSVIAVATQVTSLSGCAAVQTVHGLYGTAKAGVTAVNSYKMVKDMKDAQPYFKDYDSLRFSASINPRDTESGADIQAAFIANSHKVIEDNLRMAGYPLQVCKPHQSCSGRVLNLVFTEEGFDRNLLEKATLGNKLRGTLVLTDAQTQAAVAAKRMGPFETYADAVALLHGFIWPTVYRSAGEQMDPAYQGDLEGYQPVMPEYRDQLNSN